MSNHEMGEFLAALRKSKGYTQNGKQLGNGRILPRHLNFPSMRSIRSFRAGSSTSSRKLTAALTLPTGRKT